MVTKVTRWEAGGQHFPTEGEAHQWENEQRARKELEKKFDYADFIERDANKAIEFIMSNRDFFRHVLVRADYCGPWDECSLFSDSL